MASLVKYSLLGQNIAISKIHCNYYCKLNCWICQVLGKSK